MRRIYDVLKILFIQLDHREHVGLLEFACNTSVRFCLQYSGGKGVVQTQHALVRSTGVLRGIQIGTMHLVMLSNSVKE
jgi:hypothetical protein